MTKLIFGMSFMIVSTQNTKNVYNTETLKRVFNKNVVKKHIFFLERGCENDVREQSPRKFKRML